MKEFPGVCRRWFILSWALPVLMVWGFEPDGRAFEQMEKSAHRLWGNWVEQTADRGYIIAGTMWSLGLGPGRAILIRTDPEGNVGWLRQLGGVVMEQGSCVQQTVDGGYVVAGTSWRREGHRADVYLAKTDNRGNVVWSRTFGGPGRDHGKEVQQTGDGGYVIVGDTTSPEGGSRDVYLVKTDNTGRELWSKRVGGAGDDWGYSVRQTWDGGYIIGGTSNSFNAGQKDGFLIRTDPGGRELWHRVFGGQKRDGLRSVRQTPKGGFVSAGSTESFGSGKTDVFLVGTDPLGTPRWIKTHGNRHGEYGLSVRPTRDGGTIVAGYRWPAGRLGSTEVLMVKTDALGSRMWDRTFGGAGFDYGYCVAQTADNGYVVVGRTALAGRDKVYLIKTDSRGRLMWHRRYG